MLIIMKLAQEDVILAAEACAVVANVGPTSPAGWTALWSLDASAVASSLVGVRHFLVEETPDGPRLSLAAANGTHILEGFWDPQGQGSGQVVVMASALSELFQATDRQGELEELLREEPSDADQLIERLALALELPELIEPEPTRAAVAFRGDPAIARFAAALVGPAYLQSGSEGWSVLGGFGQDLKTPEVVIPVPLSSSDFESARRSGKIPGQR